jgi:Lon protease-like protein
MVEPLHLPLFPLRTVLFPGGFIPIHVFEERYLTMIGHCLEGGHPFGVVLIRVGREVGGPAVPYGVGTTARVRRVQRMEDGRMNIIAQGERRFRILRMREEDPYPLADVELLEDEDGADTRVMEAVARLFHRYMQLNLMAVGQWSRPRPLPQEPSALADLVAHHLAIDPRRKQDLLETLSVQRRLEMEEDILSSLVEEAERRARGYVRQRWGGFWALN